MFDHHRLDAFRVAREALVLGDDIARRLPRGHASLADQLRRALLAAYLGHRRRREPFRKRSARAVSMRAR